MVNYFKLQMVQRKVFINVCKRYKTLELRSHLEGGERAAAEQYQPRRVEGISERFPAPAPADDQCAPARCEQR